MQSCKLNKETCASGASLPCPGAPGEGLLCAHHFFSSEVQGRRERESFVSEEQERDLLPFSASKSGRKWQLR